jgi:hypothetical protein
MVMIAGWSHHLVDSTQEGLFRQLAAWLQVTGVTTGGRPLVVIADGARWIRAWFTALAVPHKTMVLCWDHLRKHCYQKISGSGLPRATKKPLLGQVLTALMRRSRRCAASETRRSTNPAPRIASSWLPSRIASVLINAHETMRPLCGLTALGRRLPLVVMLE